MSVKRVAVVTGSNKGIGFAIVKELCSKFDGNVYLTSRNEGRGVAAIKELKKLGLSPKYHQLDINDKSSVIRLRDHLKITYGGLDSLVNNAGIGMFQVSHLFAEQASKTVGTNFFGTNRVCDALFPILKPHARVVNVASSMGQLGMMTGQSDATVGLKKKLTSTSLTKEELCQLMQNFIDSAAREEHDRYGWPDIYYIATKTGMNILPRNHKQLTSPLLSPEDVVMDTSYVVSKVGVCALTRIQQRQFDQDPRGDLIVNAVHPGYINSDMTMGKGHLSIEEGAAAPSWLALLPENVEGPKGAYVWHDKQIIDWVNGPMAGYY